MWVLVIFLLTPVYEIQTVNDSVAVSYAVQTFIFNCNLISYVEPLLKGNSPVTLKFKDKEGRILKEISLSLDGKKKRVRFDFCPL